MVSGVPGDAMPGTVITKSFEAKGCVGLMNAEPVAWKAPWASKSSQLTPISSVAETVTVSVPPRSTSVTPSFTSKVTTGLFTSSTSKLMDAASEAFPAASTASALRFNVSAAVAPVGIATWKMASTLLAAGETALLSKNEAAPLASRLTEETVTLSCARTRTSSVSPGVTVEPSVGLAI